MDIVWENEKERERVLDLAHQSICIAERAREALEAGNSELALALYYRLDTELLARLYKRAPKGVQADLASRNEPPGK